MKTPKFAVVICNWNKKAFLSRCLESVFKSTLIPDKVIVVDNASNDGSQEFLASYNDDRLHLINKLENTGGSGGFHTGVKCALEFGYEFVHLLDNDAFVEPDCFANLLEHIQSDDKIGAVGAKILIDGQPIVQEIGAKVDWGCCSIIKNYSMCEDNSSLPEVISCDYLPACSVMVRSLAIKKAGNIDESFFIYWDDIDWFWKIKSSGYKVLAISSAVANHTLGSRVKTSTFATYYFTRNRIIFFLKNCDIQSKSEVIDELLKVTFNTIFFSKFKEDNTTALTAFNAMIDALNLNLWKANEKYIRSREENPALQKFLSKCSAVSLRYSGDPEVDTLITSFLDEHNISIGGGNTLSICNHISDIKEFEDGVIYIDRYLNLILSENDFLNLNSYSDKLLQFKKKYTLRFEELFLSLRSDEHGE